MVTKKIAVATRRSTLPRRRREPRRRPKSTPAVVVGSLEITFADYGVTVPQAPVVVSVDDFGIVEMQLLFTRP